MVQHNSSHETESAKNTWEKAATCADRPRHASAKILARLKNQTCHARISTADSCHLPSTLYQLSTWLVKLWVKLWMFGHLCQACVALETALLRRLSFTVLKDDHKVKRSFHHSKESPQAKLDGWNLFSDENLQHWKRYISWPKISRRTNFAQKIKESSPWVRQVIDLHLHLHLHVFWSKVPLSWLGCSTAKEL